MEFGPVFRSLLRHKMAALLVSLQCALALAVLINATLVVQEKRQELARDPGFNIDNTIGIASLPLRDGENRLATMQAEMAAMRAIPGVKSVTMLSAGIPLATAGWNQSLITGEGDQQRGVDNVDVLIADENVVDTLDLKIIAGRNLRADDVIDVPASEQAAPPQAVLVNESTARAFFGEESALGKQVNGMTIVGVVADFFIIGPAPVGSVQGIIMPGRRQTGLRSYMIRTEGNPESLLPTIERELRNVNPDRFINGRYIMTKELQRVRGNDRGTVIGLSVVMVLITLITVAGIVGINVYHLRKRMKWLGVRRALGASRFDILRLLLLENALIIGIGIVLGMIGAVVLNMQASAIPRLLWQHGVIGAALVIVIVMLAVLLTVRPAMRVSPALATRNV